MYYNVREYENIIGYVDKANEGLKTALINEFKKREPSASKMALDNVSKNAGRSIIYSLFQNGYDPRSGQVLIAYVEKHKSFDTEVFVESLANVFGEYKVLKKEDYKYINSTSYQKNALTILFTKEFDDNTSLQVVVCDNPKVAYKQDEEKYDKFLAKEPKGGIY